MASEFPFTSPDSNEQNLAYLIQFITTTNYPPIITWMDIPQRNNSLSKKY